MIPIPEPIVEAIGATLHGRARLGYFAAIAGRAGVLPTTTAALAYVRAQYRRSIGAGEIAQAVLFGAAYAAQWQDLPGVSDLNALLARLGETRWAGTRVLEVSGCPDPLPGRVLIFAENLTLQPAGRVAVVTVVDEDMVRGVLLRAEIRASSAHPEPRISVRLQEGWAVFQPGDLASHPIVDVALRGVSQLAEAPARVDAHQVLFVPLDAPESEHGLVDESLGWPPDDPQYTDRLAAVMTGAAPCTEVRIPLGAVRPFSYEYAFEHARRPVALVEGEMRAGAEPPLVVYWDGQSYVVSDDYACLLAYRNLGRHEVPAVVLGHVAPGLGTVGRTGGRELVPGAGIYPLASDASDAAEAANAWAAQVLAKAEQPSLRLVELHLLYVHLLKLLAAPGVRERSLHEFLATHPVVFDAYSRHVLSEVRLGADYRVDLVVEYGTSERQILLVELERADLPLFTEAGRLRAPIQHARQQVEDWFRWWREHPDDVPAPLDGTVPLHGMVVAGRSVGLSDDDRRRLYHLNEGQRVKLVTFDDLLARLERLIDAVADRNRQT